LSIPQYESLIEKYEASAWLRRRMVAIGNVSQRLDHVVVAGGALHCRDHFGGLPTPAKHDVTLVRYLDTVMPRAPGHRP
jgi:hypothetical protein